MSSGRERLATAPQTGEDRERIFDAFRRWGYLAANLDPLGFLHPFVHPEIDVSGEIADQARRVYCGAIGAEFMHSADAERCRWIAERIERGAAEPDRSGGAAAKQSRVLGRLIRAELFEQVLQARYLGSKRFSLEGVTALIPLLDRVLSAARSRRGPNKSCWA